MSETPLPPQAKDWEARVAEQESWQMGDLDFSFLGPRIVMVFDGGIDGGCAVSVTMPSRNKPLTVDEAIDASYLGVRHLTRYNHRLINHQWYKENAERVKRFSKALREEENAHGE